MRRMTSALLSGALLLAGVTYAHENHVEIKDIVGFICTVIAGLFVGYLTSIIAIFVWSLLKEGLSYPKKMGVAALILLSWFGIGFVGLLSFAFQNWLMFLVAIVAFGQGIREIIVEE